MLGKITVEIICDSCNKEKEVFQASPLTKEGEYTKIVVFADQIPKGWTELVIERKLQYICNKCMKGAPNSGYAF